MDPELTTPDSEFAAGATTPKGHWGGEVPCQKAASSKRRWHDGRGTYFEPPACGLARDFKERAPEAVNSDAGPTREKPSKEAPRHMGRLASM